MNTWGKHLTIDAASCNHNVTDKEVIAKFATDLVQLIDMKAYGDPQVIHFGEDDKQGITLLQLIETSNITAHFCDQSGDCYLDVFSCKDFDPQDVVDFFSLIFQPKAIDFQVKTRQAPRVYK